MNRKEKEIETKRRLMEATEAVFSRRGFAQATVDEIIALADTGKGTAVFIRLVFRGHVSGYGKLPGDAA